MSVFHALLTSPAIMTRFICSQNPAEVESVKKELFLAGIRSEIRSNPLANALRLTRLELWLHDERDLFSASKIYAGIRDRAEGEAGNRAVAKDQNPPGYTEVDDPPDFKAGEVHQQNAKIPEPAAPAEPSADEFARATALLEGEIDELLYREGELRNRSAILENQVRELNKGLAQAQGELAREKESRAVVEKQHGGEIARLQSALQGEQLARAQAQEQLERERREWQLQLETRDQSLARNRQELNAATEQVKKHEASVGELRKEKDALARSYVARLNSLRGKLQSPKRVGLQS